MSNKLILFPHNIDFGWLNRYILTDIKTLWIALIKISPKKI